VHPPQFRKRALELRAAGVSFSDICRVLGLPRRTVGHWFHGERARHRAELDALPSPCPRCSDPPRDVDDPAAYAYLLGLYLGDGHLVTSAKVPVLRIYCTTTWPGLIVACEAAMLQVLANRVHKVNRVGCVAVQSYSKHWPCFFPQHGSGKKHDRVIELADWQKDLVENNPVQLLRGLFHSDGCRVTNRVTRNGKQYSYPRYNFANESGDIMAICQQSLDRLGIGWRMCRRNLLSVARAEAVAELDTHVGPKC
jgi:hypothetical protein